MLRLCILVVLPMLVWGDPSPVIALLERVVGPDLSKLFELKVSSDHQEWFELGPGSAAGHVSVEASSLSSLSAGLGAYLKDYCNATLSWQHTGGFRPNLAAKTLPPVNTPVRVSKSVPWSYYQNVVDYSYSYVWWDWARWEMEIDWMGLHGINLALAYTGQEAVYRKAYKLFGLSDTQLGDFFDGPAFLAWSRGQGMAGVGGPLPIWWYDQQKDLNQKIVARMRSLGITTVLPGFQGNVPKELKTLYPHANISKSGWLDALDPLFANISSHYMSALIDAFGTDHFYQADGFFSDHTGPWSVSSKGSTPCSYSSAISNQYIAGCADNCRSFSSLSEAEQGCTETMTCGGITRESSGQYQLRSGSTSLPSPTNETSWVVTNPGACHPLGPIKPDHDAYLHSHAAYQGMAVTDPKATWVYQTWIWRGYGVDKLPFLKGWISGVPTGKLLLLDQTAERIPLWSAFEHYSFFNASFVWCAMHEMGGNVGLFGDFDAINSSPVAAFERSSVTGVGIDPEGINQNPAYYEFVLETAWRSSAVNVPFWFKHWARQRCGHDNPNAQRAWSLLAQTVYSGEWQHYEHHMKYCPTTMPYGSNWDKPMVRVPYNVSMLHEAWGLLIDAADDCNGAPYAYDLVDVGREYLSVAPCVHYYDQLVGAKTKADIQAANASMLEILDDVDILLSSNAGFLLGTWLHDARKLAATAGATTAEQDLLEWNARSQVTSWEPVGEVSSTLSGLWDYGNKAWGGLVRAFYKQRYSIYADHAARSVATKTAFDEAAFHHDLNSFARAFQHDRFDESTFPITPQGDAIAISRMLFKKYSPDTWRADEMAS